MRVLYFLFLDEEDFSNPIHKHMLEGNRVPASGEILLIKEVRYEVKQIFTDFENKRIQVYVK